jgi:TonB family protein
MSKPETWKSWEGRVVDGFPLQQWLGGSAHSTVFLTELPGTPPQKAAIKLIEAESGPESDRQISRLRATTKLSHPNLLRNFQVGQCQIDGTSLFYVVMEFAEEDLSQILPQRALEPAEVGEMLPPLLGALSYLHGQGLVHGRIKPSNVQAVVDRLKLSSDQVTSITDQNSGGRRRDVYDAPETAAGIVSPASDIWSVGVTMVAALTQSVAFAANDSKNDPNLPESIREPFRSIARECLHLDPKQRISLNQIEGRLKPREERGPASVSRAEATAPAAGKRPAFPITIATTVVLIIVFAFLYLHGKKGAVSNPEETAPSRSANPPAATPLASGSPAPARSTNSAGEVSHQVLPDVPQNAKNTISGTIKVVVRVQVGTSGKVTSATFKSVGSSRYFADRALTAAQQWEFSPPQNNGQPLASTWLIQFRFRRGSTQASAERVNR